MTPQVRTRQRITRQKYIAYQLSEPAPHELYKSHAEHLVTVVRLKYNISISPHKNAHNENYPPPGLRLGTSVPKGAVDIILEASINVRGFSPYGPSWILYRTPDTLLRRAQWFAKLDFSTFFLSEAWSCLSDALTLWAAHASRIPEELIKATEKADKCKRLADGASTKHESCTALRHGVAIMLKLSGRMKEEKKEEKKTEAPHIGQNWLNYTDRQRYVINREQVVNAGPLSPRTPRRP